MIFIASVINDRFSCYNWLSFFFDTPISPSPFPNLFFHQSMSPADISRHTEEGTWISFTGVTVFNVRVAKQFFIIRINSPTLRRHHSGSRKGKSTFPEIERETEGEKRGRPDGREEGGGNREREWERRPPGRGGRRGHVGPGGAAATGMGRGPSCAPVNEISAVWYWKLDIV